MIDHYPVKFRKTGPAVTPEDIAACEKSLKLKFPHAYIDFLLEHNGGSPSPAYLMTPGILLKVTNFFPIAPDGLADVNARLRTEYKLPKQYLAIAVLNNSEDFLLVDCAAKSKGTVLRWNYPEDGFWYEDEEACNVEAFYAPIEELFFKFGPQKNREDRDGLFCRLYYSSSDAGNGPTLATQFVDGGYDINFVLPTFRHPIFGAIDSQTFQVVEALICLGTSLTHKDPLNKNASVEKRLAACQKEASDLLAAVADEPTNRGPGSSFELQKRKLARIESAMAAVEAAKK